MLSVDTVCTRRAWNRQPPGATLLLLAVALLPGLGIARASGPRWVTGSPYFTAPAGQSVVWFTDQPRYFTDPGDLSASVNHAAADAIVAAAANVWNVPTAALVVAYGGALNQHVSGANAYLGPSGPVFPADVQSSNYAAKQIAVVYDSDGSVTDMLLGSGASSPAECRQNGVTESVDAISPAGLIQHAILVLNGRCTGPASEQQLQLQYQLERAFGRIIGIGWSQTNDNVFTQSPQPTYQQAMHWPIMHPIDIVCGDYTYQCLPQPFTLRDDDISAITTLYPMIVWNQFPTTAPAPGKVWSYVQASRAYGTVSFPTGQGMQGVNVVVQRLQGGWNIPEGWYDVSSVSGYRYRRNDGNPVNVAATGQAASMGSTDISLEGYYDFGWIPDIDPAGAQNGQMLGVVTTEAINPLYVGSYAVGPYVAGSVSPSGAAQTEITPYVLQPFLYSWIGVDTEFAPGDAAATCNPSDGVESAPQPVAAIGWWPGVLCAHGHTAWSTFSVQPGRTATIEVTAHDESGAATTAKAMPLIGVWGATDATGMPPTIAATPSAFNSMTLGMTSTHLEAAAAACFRFVIADARGDGRPDFAYQARVLYADSIQPTITSIDGGQITIRGSGFRTGNTVTVNGVPAMVSSWSATAIVAVAPLESAFRSHPTGPVDVVVSDPATGGSTAMAAVLTYGSLAPDTMVTVSAPPAVVAVGSQAPFAVRVTQGDGITPVVGLPVTFTVVAGSAQTPTSGAGPIVLTDATGVAATTVTPTAFGTVTVEATAVGASQFASFQAVALGVTPVRPVEYVAAGATVTWTPQVTVVENGATSPGVTVAWTGSAGMTVSPASSAADAFGMAQASATSGPLAAGAQATGQACAWTTACATLTAVGVDSAALRLVVLSGAGQTVPSARAFAPVVVLVTDLSGNPVAGASVGVYQAVDAAEIPCPTHGACPIPPVLDSSRIAAVSDANGKVTVTPMQVAGTAAVTNIAVAAGTQGFASLSLQQSH